MPDQVADFDLFTAALLSAVQAVVPPGQTVSTSTTLNETTLDSLGLLEALVHLERETSVALGDELVREVALDPEFDLNITIEALARVIERVRIRAVKLV